MASTELVLLHALPLDGSMWAAQQQLMPGATHSPTLYPLGDTVSEWAGGVLNRVQGDRLIVVGNSVGGSCALEMAAVAPERIAALVLIGTKAGHRPDPEFHANALQLLREKGMGDAWDTYWAPLFSRSTDPRIVDEAKHMALSQSVDDLVRGVTAFHTRIGREGLLATLPHPTFFLVGEDDKARGRRIVEREVGQSLNARFVMIPACGHYVPLEQPDRLNAILSRLIADLA